MFNAGCKLFANNHNQAFPLFQMKKINLRKKPYRGIVTEISEEFDRSKSAVTLAIQRGTSWVIPVIEKKIRERKQQQLQEQRRIKDAFTA